MDESITIYQLTAAELDATKAKVAKLNERAEAKGLTGRLEVVADKVEDTETLPNGLEVTRVYWDTVITGEAPSYGGWKFIAVLDWDDAAGLITRTVPGFAGVIDRDALRANWCDHCNTTRNRVETYLVEGQDGERRQVGSTCIRDFLGQAVRPVWIFNEADSLREEFLSLGGVRDYDYTPESVVKVAWAVIQEYGFVPSSWDGSTKGRVLTVLYPPSKGQAARDAHELIKRLQPHVDAATGQARLIIDFIKSDAFGGASEYVTNLKAIVSGERVGSRHFGLLVSAPQAWAREVERDLRRQAAKAELVNAHFGQPGDKVELTVRVKSISYSHHNYGTSTVYKLVTDTGHLVTWFASSSSLGDEVTNETFKIKATVKKHDEYQDVKSTVITRAKVTATIPAQGEAQAA